MESKQSMDILVVLLKGEMMITSIQKSMINKYGTYPPHYHIIKNVRNLIQMGLAKKRVEGRKTMISLTPKGELVARLLKQVKDEIYG